MHKLGKIGVLACMLAMSACSSMKTKSSKEESEKARVAKINAQLGIAYLEQQQINRAKEKLMLSIKQGPNIPEPWYSLAYYKESTGDLESANKFYQKAIEVSNGRGDAENNYGTFLCRTGKYKEAIQHFEVAAQDSEYLTPADAYENAGLCASRIAGKNNAADYFNKALRNDPERAVSWMALAEIHFKKGDYKAANSELGRFLALSPPTDRSMALNAKLSKKVKTLA